MSDDPRIVRITLDLLPEAAADIFEQYQADTKDQEDWRREPFKVWAIKRLIVRGERRS